MGIFDWIFGSRTAAAADAPDDEDDIESTEPTNFPIEGPPVFLRAVELQRKYWRYDADEQARLIAIGVDKLNWRDCFRLHHLNCMQRIQRGPAREDSTEKCRQTTNRLLADNSPYRPRPALVWQGKHAQGEDEREPEHQGIFLNPSLTHLAALEIFRLDDKDQPASIDFVSFDDLSGVIFAPPSLLRMARIFQNDKNDVVLVPLLYATTWSIGTKYDRNGEMTRFVAHLDDKIAQSHMVTGIGVGHQDFSINKGQAGAGFFGLGSVFEIHFPLELTDPRFDEKARARGIDPDEARRNSKAN